MNLLIAILIWVASLLGFRVDQHPDGVTVEYTTIVAPGVQCFRHVWIGTNGDPAMGEICSPADR